jgi:hypothetical protein
MRTTFHVRGGGGGPRRPRARHRARVALISVLLVMAFGGGMLVAAVWEALSDNIEARGEMDPSW